MSGRKGRKEICWPVECDQPWGGRTNALDGIRPGGGVEGERDEGGGECTR